MCQLQLNGGGWWWSLSLLYRQECLRLGWACWLTGGCMAILALCKGRTERKNWKLNGNEKPNNKANSVPCDVMDGFVGWLDGMWFLFLTPDFPHIFNSYRKWFCQLHSLVNLVQFPCELCVAHNFWINTPPHSPTWLSYADGTKLILSGLIMMTNQFTWHKTTFCRQLP